MDLSQVASLPHRAGPYIVGTLLTIGAVVLAALVAGPIGDLVEETRARLDALRRRMLVRSAIFFGRRMHRFWLLRQHEPARGVSAALGRIGAAIPAVGQSSVAHLRSLQADLGKQLAVIEVLGIHPPEDQVSGSGQAAAVSSHRMKGRVGYLIVLVVIALVAGGANSFLLNEFFQGVFPSGVLFPATFPDLHVSHIFAVLIFVIEVAIGFALHFFGRDQTDESAARRIFGLAPWAGLIALLCLEFAAYAVLSSQINLPARLKLSPESGLYDLAKYFLAGFGVALTLLLGSMGYLIGGGYEDWAAGRVARRHQKILRQYRKTLKSGEDQVERTEAAVQRLKAAVQDFPRQLTVDFARELEGASQATALREAIATAAQSVLDSAALVDGALERRLQRLQARAQRPIRTRAQALADLCLFTGALVLLVVVGVMSVGYLAAYARSVQGGHSYTEIIAYLVGFAGTAFVVGLGYMARESRGGARYGSMRARFSVEGGRPFLWPATAIFFTLAAGVLAGIAVANQTLGNSVFLNLLFGVSHACMLALLGAVADAAMANAMQVVYLVGLLGARVLVVAGALILSAIRSALALGAWVVDFLAIFGRLFVRGSRARRAATAMPAAASAESGNV